MPYKTFSITIKKYKSACGSQYKKVCPHADKKTIKDRKGAKRKINGPASSGTPIETANI